MDTDNSVLLHQNEDEESDSEDEFNFQVGVQHFDRLVTPEDIPSGYIPHNFLEENELNIDICMEKVKVGEIIDRSAQFARKFLPILYPKMRFNRELFLDLENTIQRREILIGFKPILRITQAVGLLTLALMVIWIHKFNQGFEKRENYHFFLSSLVLYLMGNGILSFRMFRNFSKKKLKVIHNCIHGFTIVFALYGIYIMIVHKMEMSFIHFYSMHTWIGLISVVLFLVQGLVGFYGFMFPGFHTSLKYSYLPFHVYIGSVVFVLLIGSAITGITKLMAVVKELNGATVLLNFIGVFFMVYGVLVIYLVSNCNYKRNPRKIDYPETGPEA